ncbi:putative F-box/LRR-repeat protein 23 [Vicia villosa]|uniref:putative F-box/LRR-repeat protein 23 n=1 Tax=Vicia villosa TaxID=3911 RepID=UPI00273B6576|nr:putative F-box/LRR-repeat protein 23 [Vicia villosa]
MATCTIGAKGEECESSSIPNWLELPRDIAVNILQRLDTIDIVTSACLVCPTWWNYCKEPLVWRTIHMTANSLRWNNQDLEKICRYAVERSCGHLEEIDIEHFATNDLLQCIAEKASNLRSMKILKGWGISEKVFTDVVRKLPQLEEVDISMCPTLLKDSLETLCLTCPLLKVLKFENVGEVSYIGGDNNDDDAYMISETLPRLCHLGIKGNKLTNSGLLAILDGCPLLESLDMEGCSNLDLDEGLKEKCLEQIKDVRLPAQKNHEYYEYRDFLEDCYYAYFDPYDF